MAITRPLSAIPLWNLTFWAVGLGVGVWFGIGIADSLAGGGLAVVGALGGALLALGLLAGAAVVAAILWRTPDGSGRSAARALFVAGGLFAVGLGLGWVAAPIVRPAVQGPVTLEASGTMAIALDGIDGYESRTDGTASCRSGLDGEVVAAVSVDLAGRVGTHAVGGSLTILPDVADGPQVLIWFTSEVEASDTRWQGPVDVVEQADGERSGRAVFSALPLVPVKAGADGSPTPWPTSLSGTVTWTCGGWRDPADDAAR